MKQLFFLFSICGLAWACSDDVAELQPDSRVKRAVNMSQIQSPALDWEQTDYVDLTGIGKTILPWYSGALTVLPVEFLTEYKAEDGWKLVYNFCSPSPYNVYDNYYLFFYNIFSGKLRGYYYNAHDVTSADHTFWQLTFSQPTKLLNDAGTYSLPIDTLTDERTILVSNMNTSPVKSLTRGWNAFELDLVPYDAALSQKNLTMGLVAYDSQESVVKLESNLQAYSSGSIVTQQVNTNTNPIASLMGNVAKDVLTDLVDEKLGDKNGTSRGLVSDLIGKAVTSGVNWITRKFFSKKTETAISYDLKFTTKGTSTSDGTITRNQMANIPPVANLLIPGASVSPNDVFLPSYTQPLGVWSLKSAPVIERKIEMYANRGELGVRYPAWAPRNMISRGTVYQLTAITKDDVVINPAILPYIENYEVSAQVVEEWKQSSDYVNKTRRDNQGRLVAYDDCLNLYFSKKDTLAMTYWLGNQHVESTSTPIGGGGIFERNAVSLSSDNVRTTTVKVTVTIYPKAPYTTEPRIMTRTFIPKIVTKSLL